MTTFEENEKMTFAADHLSDRPQHEPDDFRSGFISLIGRPNVGKSTLLNHLAGMQLAITSPKPQTTRHMIQAVLNEEKSQMVFLDTPGMHRPKTRLGSSMKAAVQTAIRQADVIVILVDAKAATGPKAFKGIPDTESDIIRAAQARHVPMILVFNKVDHVKKEDLLPLISLYSQAYQFEAILPISARTGDGSQLLLSEIKRLLPVGPRLFPVDMITDQTERGLASELIREQLLYQTEQEIPHGIAVDIEQFEEQFHEVTGERQRASIHAVIYCEKDTHKGIIIGKKGAMLKAIGTSARQHIEQMLDCPVYLELFVKVREDWRNRPGMLRSLGYDNHDQS